MSEDAKPEAVDPVDVSRPEEAVDDKERKKRELERQLREELKNYRRKAELQRNAHSTLGEELQTRERRFSTGVVACTGLATLTIFANLSSASEAIGFPDWLLPVVAGCVSAAAFVIEIVIKHLGWRERMHRHLESMHLWTNWIRETTELLTKQPTSTKLSEALESYREVAQASAVVPNSRFLELKDAWYEKLWISRELDKQTGETVQQLRRRYRNQPPAEGVAS